VKIVRAILAVVVGYVLYAAASMLLVGPVMANRGVLMAVVALMALALIGLVTGVMAKLLAGLLLAVLVGACADPLPKSETLVEIGVVPLPPEHAGRDGGFSGVLQGRSVWVFGDTFLPRTAEDGLRWRSSSWSWTTDFESNDGIGPFRHALGFDGMAVQLLPHTSAELDFNQAHEGHEDCQAQEECGSRQTPWPGAMVVDSSGQTGVIFYMNMETGPKGQWDFHRVSGSVATWSDPARPANRIEPPLFSSEEPSWGSAAVLVGDEIYVFAYEHQGSESPCLLARVPFQSATNRRHYRFWSGAGVWSEDWQDAVPVFDCAPGFSVHFNQFLGQYLALYMAGMSEMITMRTADYPEGPWSKPQTIGRGVSAHENWDYFLIAHPELSREGGRVEILSYTRPAGFLRQEIRLLELHLDQLEQTTTRR
jgi:hypothetical protein